MIDFLFETRDISTKSLNVSNKIKFWKMITFLLTQISKIILRLKKEETLGNDFVCVIRHREVTIKTTHDMIVTSVKRFFESIGLSNNSRKSWKLMRQPTCSLMCKMSDVKVSVALYEVFKFN